MYNLSYIVNFVKMDLDESTTSRDKKILQYAIHGYRKLNLLASDEVEVVYLTPNEVFQAPLPVDYAFYTKIGVLIGGRVMTLTLNPELSLQNLYDQCGELSISALSETAIDEDVAGRWTYAPHYRNGNYVGEMYGVTGGQNYLGYFKIFSKQNVIQFDANFPKYTFILEYVTNGAKLRGSSIISSPSIEPLRAYCHWQLKEHDDSVALSTKKDKQAQYDYAVEEFKQLLYTPTIDEWLDGCWSGIKSSPKR